MINDVRGEAIHLLEDRNADALDVVKKVYL